MERGEIWWASLREPIGSEPGSRRPVVIVSDNGFNRSQIRTIIVIVVTSNVALAQAPGNVYLAKHQTGLPLDSVANISQIITLDKNFLTERVGSLTDSLMEKIDDGLRMVLYL